jgi:hypothetical protein
MLFAEARQVGALSRIGSHPRNALMNQAPGRPAASSRRGS